MSERKPFAYSTRGPDVWYELWVADECVGQFVDGRVATVSRINTAVAARERAAAARALEEAARDFVGHRSGDDEWTADVVRAWLRSRAAAGREGSTT